MPVIQFKKPDIPLAASKLPEPLQKVGGFVGQLLADFLGADDPMSGAYPTPAAPLVSIYKNAAGVPSKALREQGTKSFLDSVVEHVNNTGSDLYRARMGWAADRFAKKYPRVAAHMRMDKDGGAGEGYVYAPSGKAAAYAGTPWGKVKEPVNIGITEKGIQAVLDRPEMADDFLGHEGTHVAQGLGNSSFNELYSRAHRLAGYDYNPFEDSARLGGDKAVGRLSPSSFRGDTGNKTIEQLIDLIDDPNENLWKRSYAGNVITTPKPEGAVRKGIGWLTESPDFKMKEAEAARIREILEQRAGGKK